MQRVSILFFILANGLAGLLNYYFQVSAAHRLSDLEYGQFSTWFATVSGMMIFGAIAQYYANYSNFFRIKSALSKALALLVFLSLFFVISLENYFLVGALGTVLCSVLFGYFIGLFQREKMFFHFGAMGFFFALLRVLVVFSGLAQLKAFVFSTWFSQGLTALVIALFFFPVQKPKEENFSFISTSVLIAVFAIIMPNFDLALLSWNHSAEEIAWLGRSLLPAKLLFFCGAIFLQVLLPYQAKGERPFLLGTRRSFYLAYFFAAIIFSALSEMLLPLLFSEGARVIPKVIFLGSFNFSILLLCQFELQAMPQERIKSAYYSTIAVVLLALALVLFTENVAVYFSLMTIFRIALLAKLLRKS